MSKWTEGLARNVVANLVAAAIFSALSALWAFVRGLSPSWIVGVAAIAFAAVWFGIHILVLFQQRRDREPVAKGTAPADLPSAQAPQPPQHQTPKAFEYNAPIIEDGFEFYPGHRSLPDARKLPALVESARHEVWALWNTGTVAFRAKMLETGKIQRLLLPHPDEVGPLLAAAEGGDAEKIKVEIRDLTRLAQRIARDNHLTIAVRWFRPVPQNALLIDDPYLRGDSTWVQVEQFQPRAPSDMLPIIRYNHRRFSYICNALTTAYVQLWEAAVEPPPLPQQREGEALVAGLFRDAVFADEVAAVDVVVSKIVGECVYLAVANDGDPDEFIAQVTEFRGAEPEAVGHWSIKWDGTTDERRQIFRGTPRLLELAVVDAMGTFGPAGGRPGRFFFLGPRERKEVWLNQSKARRLGTNFIYETKLQVTLRVASVTTGKSRSFDLEIGIDRELKPTAQIVI